MKFLEWKHTCKTKTFLLLNVIRYIVKFLLLYSRSDVFFLCKICGMISISKLALIITPMFCSLFYGYCLWKLLWSSSILVLFNWLAIAWLKELSPDIIWRMWLGAQYVEIGTSLWVFLINLIFLCFFSMFWFIFHLHLLSLCLLHCICILFIPSHFFWKTLSVCMVDKNVFQTFF